MVLPFQPEPMHPVFHPLKDRAARKNCRCLASLIRKSPRRQSTHLQIIHIDAAIPIANTVVQHHRDRQLRVLQKLQIRIGRIADDGRMAVCATGQCLAFLQVVVDIWIDDQPHRTCRFFRSRPADHPRSEASCWPGNPVPRTWPPPAHWHRCRPADSGQPYWAGSRRAAAAKIFFLRGRADLPLCRLAAQNNADRTGRDPDLLRDLLDRNHALPPPFSDIRFIVPVSPYLDKPKSLSHLKPAVFVHSVYFLFSFLAVSTKVAFLFSSKLRFFLDISKSLYYTQYDD